MHATGNLTTVMGVDPALRLTLSETGPPELKAVVAALGYSHGALSGPQQVVHTCKVPRVARTG
eukprot:4824703-Amphidinium_carterae.1